VQWHDNADVTCCVLLVLVWSAGGFESGDVKVWLISQQSLISLRKTSIDANSGMSIPALQLLSEWTAHDSCVLDRK
jgi:hypothetical protein